MPTSVTMPALGESVTEGTVTRWLKQEGDQVEVDEPLREVSTDKADTDIPSPAAGVLTKILVAEDEPVAASDRDRQANGRVPRGQRPADHRGGGRHHPDREAARPGEERLRHPRGRQAVLPAVLRQGR